MDAVRALAVELSVVTKTQRVSFCQFWQKKEEEKRIAGEDARDVIRFLRPVNEWVKAHRQRWKMLFMYAYGRLGHSNLYPPFKCRVCRWKFFGHMHSFIQPYPAQSVFALHISLL